MRDPLDFAFWLIAVAIGLCVALWIVAEFGSHSLARLGVSVPGCPCACGDGGAP